MFQTKIENLSMIISSVYTDTEVRKLKLVSSNKFLMPKKWLFLPQTTFFFEPMSQALDTSNFEFR